MPLSFQNSIAYEEVSGDPSGVKRLAKIKIKTIYLSVLFNGGGNKVTVNNKIREIRPTPHKPMLLLYYNMIENFRNQFSNNAVKYLGNYTQDSNRTVIVDFVFVTRFVSEKEQQRFREGGWTFLDKKRRDSIRTGMIVFLNVSNGGLKKGSSDLKVIDESRRVVTDNRTTGNNI